MERAFGVISHQQQLYPKTPECTSVTLITLTIAAWLILLSWTRGFPA